MEKENIAQFFHFNFNVIDMEKMIEFYEKGFGYTKCLEKVFEGEDFKRRLVLLSTGQKSNFKIEFLQHIKPVTMKCEPPGPTNVGANHLGIPVDNIDKKYEELKVLGMKWETDAPIDVPDAKIRIVFGRDIEGNRIELLQKLDK